jgi:zinc D-Ala-D-Ala carboxypeptidase
MVNLNLSLSADFKLWEFVKSVTADQNGIKNLPNETEIAHLRLLCQKIIQPARKALGPMKISSGFRSEALNKLVGGAENSDHRLGYAADVIPYNVGTRKLAEWVVKNCPQFDQVILEFGTLKNPSWIHLSIAPRNRKQVSKGNFQE